MRDDQIEVALMVPPSQVREVVGTCTRDADRKLVKISERVRKHLEGSSPQLVTMVWERCETSGVEEMSGCKAPARCHIVIYYV